MLTHEGVIHGEYQGAARVTGAMYLCAALAWCCKPSESFQSSGLRLHSCQQNDLTTSTCPESDSSLVHRQRRRSMQFCTRPDWKSLKSAKPARLL